MFILRFDMRAPMSGAAVAATRHASASGWSTSRRGVQRRRVPPSSASISRADSVEALRDANGPYRTLTVDKAAHYIRRGRALPLLPLCGGLPPDTAWPDLERAVTATEQA